MVSTDACRASRKNRTAEIRPRGAAADNRGHAYPAYPASPFTVIAQKWPQLPVCGVPRTVRQVDTENAFRKRRKLPPRLRSFYARARVADQVGLFGQQSLRFNWLLQGTLFLGRGNGDDMTVIV